MGFPAGKEGTKMRESIHKYFKIGTIQWMSFPRMDGKESLMTVARDDFFDAIEINVNKVGGFMEEIFGKELKPWQTDGKKEKEV